MKSNITNLQSQSLSDYSLNRENSVASDGTRVFKSLSELKSNLGSAESIRNVEILWDVDDKNQLKLVTEDGKTFYQHAFFSVQTKDKVSKEVHYYLLAKREATNDPDLGKIVERAIRAEKKRISPSLEKRVWRKLSHTMDTVFNFLMKMWKRLSNQVPNFQLSVPAVSIASKYTQMPAPSELSQDGASVLNQVLKERPQNKKSFKLNDQVTAASPRAFLSNSDLDGVIQEDCHGRKLWSCTIDEKRFLVYEYPETKEGNAAYNGPMKEDYLYRLESIYLSNKGALSEDQVKDYEAAYNQAIKAIQDNSLDSDFMQKYQNFSPIRKSKFNKHHLEMKKEIVEFVEKTAELRGNCSKEEVQKTELDWVQEQERPQIVTLYPSASADETTHWYAEMELFPTKDAFIPSYARDQGGLANLVESHTFRLNGAPDSEQVEITTTLPSFIRHGTPSPYKVEDRIKRLRFTHENIDQLIDLQTAKSGTESPCIAWLSALSPFVGDELIRKEESEHRMLREASLAMNSKRYSSTASGHSAQQITFMNVGVNDIAARQGATIACLPTQLEKDINNRGFHEFEDICQQLLARETQDLPEAVQEGINGFIASMNSEAVQKSKEELIIQEINTRPKLQELYKEYSNLLQSSECTQEQLDSIIKQIDTIEQSIYKKCEELRETKKKQLYEQPNYKKHEETLKKLLKQAGASQDPETKKKILQLAVHLELYQKARTLYLTGEHLSPENLYQFSSAYIVLMRGANYGVSGGCKSSEDRGGRLWGTYSGLSHSCIEAIEILINAGAAEINIHNFRHLLAHCEEHQNRSISYGTSQQNTGWNGCGARGLQIPVTGNKSISYTEQIRVAHLAKNVYKEAKEVPRPKTSQNPFVFEIKRFLSKARNYTRVQ